MTGDAAWWDLAACRGHDPNLWHPETLHSARADRRGRAAAVVAPQAVAICLTCPVNPACLDHALQHELDGIWAATTPTDRRRIRRTRGIQLRNPAPEPTDPAPDTGDTAA